MYTCRVDYRSLLVNWLGRQEVGFYGEVDRAFSASGGIPLQKN